MIKFHEQFDYVLREVLNVSGNGVAKSVGAHQGLVNRYRKGLTSPSIEFVQKFCDYYGVSPNWLLLNIEPIMISDIGPVRGPKKFSKELISKNELKSDLLNLKKSIISIIEKNI